MAPGADAEARRQDQGQRRDEARLGPRPGRCGAQGRRQIAVGRTAFAPAKINLFLHVDAPGEDGFHPICSLMAFADVGDRVSTFEAEALSLRLAGPFARDLAGEGDNLVLRAARALIAEARRPVAPMGLCLEKLLPVASGLGGGSSDAGAALRLLREALDLKIDNARLEALAAALGADGAACLWGAPAIAQGRGERLSSAPALPPLDAVLVNPRMPVSTPEVYRRVDAGGRGAGGWPAAPPAALQDATRPAPAVCRALRRHGGRRR